MSWIECSDCGWNIGTAPMFSSFTDDWDAEVGKPCPACGMLLIEVIPAELGQELYEALKPLKPFHTFGQAAYGLDGWRRVQAALARYEREVSE